MGGMDPRALHDQMAGISIRGRMAYALVCLEEAIHLLGLRDASLDEVLRRLWTFTSETDLSSWEESVMDMMWPTIALLDGHPVTDDDPLAEVPTELKTLLYLTVENVGRGNLYSAVVGPSVETLDGVLRVIEGAQRIGISAPPIDRFLRSSFKEAHGWGEPRSPTFFADG